MKTCIHCAVYLTDENWLKSSQKKNWYICNSCKRSKNRAHYNKNKESYKSRAKKNFGPIHNEWNRYSQLKNCTPVWADRRYIRLWYQLAEIETTRTGQKVTIDHIIPIKGKNVCGLHWEHNLQFLFKDDNSKKGVSVA